MDMNLRVWLAGMIFGLMNISCASAGWQPDVTTTLRNLKTVINSTADINTTQTVRAGNLTVSGTTTVNGTISTNNITSTGSGVNSFEGGVMVDGAGTGTGFTLRLRDGDNVDRVAVLDNGWVGIGITNPYGLFTVGSNRGLPNIMVNMTTGNIGIGTTSYNAKFHIIGTDQIAKIEGSAPVNVTTGRGLQVGVSGDSFTRMVMYTNGVIGFGGGSATRDTFLSRIGTSDLAVSSDYAGTGAANLLVIGNVGIGLTDPVGLLEVGTRPASPLFVSTDGKVGVGTTAPVGLFSVGSSATVPGFYVNSLGNVGIGTTFTGSGGPLTILGGADNSIGVICYGADITTEYMALGNLVGWGYLTAGGSASASNGLILRTALSGTENDRMSITSTGNVGIGTTVPVSKTHILGSSTTVAQSLYLEQGSIYYKIGDSCCQQVLTIGGGTVAAQYLTVTCPN